MEKFRNVDNAVQLDDGVSITPYGMKEVQIRRFPSAAVETDLVAEETPVALVYNGISHAVMMTTPSMLEEFALGFTLAEGIVPDMSHVYDLEVVEACQGMQVNIEISSEYFLKLKEHRRSMAGRTGCGLCGVESLEGLRREKKVLPFTQTFNMANYNRGLDYLNDVEHLGRMTGCTHAAVWVHADGSFAGGAEDVGRHVALDKLIGVRARSGWNDGAVFVSSRASYEMVQKAVAVGIEIMFAVSAPTAMAVRIAQESGLTLAAFSRHGKTNVYTHPERLIFPDSQAAL